MQGYLPFIGSGSSEAEESRDDPAYVEWYLTYGQAYEQLNGKVSDIHHRFKLPCYVVLAATCLFWLSLLNELSCPTWLIHLAWGAWLC